MKIFYNIKALILILVFLYILVFTNSVYSYENEQLQDCIEKAQINKSISGKSKEEIEKYCNCALDLIIDKHKNIRNSGYECALKAFNP